MPSSAFLGLMIACILGYFVASQTTDNFTIFYNALGLAVVVGGSLAAISISYRLSDVGRLFLSFFRIFARERLNHADAIITIVKIAESRGNPAGVKQIIENPNTHPFVVDGMRLVQNGIESKFVEEIMKTSIFERRSILMVDVDMMRTMSKYPPAFGMVGTVLGLVALFYGLNTEAGKAKLGINMSIALITTLYGLLISNLIFQPIADNLLSRLMSEMRLRRIILRGILMISEGHDPVIIEEVLVSFLLPSQRQQLLRKRAIAMPSRKAA